MAPTRIVAASVAHHAAAELCARIEGSGVNVVSRCNAITSGVGELNAGVMPEIVGDEWHYPSRSRLGKKFHTVTSVRDEEGRRRLACTCEAGDLSSACWHRGHRALVEHLAARPDGARLLAIELALVWPDRAIATPTAPPEATPPLPAPGSAARERKGRLATRAEEDFWMRHGPALGGREMSEVAALLDRPITSPRTAEGWVSLGEQVEQALADPAAQERLDRIGAQLRQRATVRAGARALGRPRKTAQAEVDELYP